MDEVLCFGWIDGQGRKIDDDRRQIRITPRRKGSIWSARNVARVEALRSEGRMTPAGEAAFAARRTDRTGVYSHERAEEARLTPEQEAQFRANEAAWAWFTTTAPPSYRRTALHLVVSAKREETRARRLAELIECSARGERIKQLRR